jgi:tetrahydromethanopterin S-methyltransferase subunit C
MSAELALQIVGLLVGMHMGAMHPYEKVLTLVLAFGPFIVLGAVIAVRRRHEEDPEDQPSSDHTNRPS